MPRPPLVTILALLLFAAALYLWSLAGILWIAPGALSLMAGKYFMYGLEVAGPYMILFFGAGYALIGWGLFWLQNWARWAAILVMVLGVASLVPKISTAELGIPLIWYGFQIAARVAVGWHLAQAPSVIDAFAQPRSNSPQSH